MYRAYSSIGECYGKNHPGPDHVMEEHVEFAPCPRHRPSWPSVLRRTAHGIHVGFPGDSNAFSGFRAEAREWSGWFVEEIQTSVCKTYDT